MSKIEWPSDSDKFEAIGYLAKPGVVANIEATVPKDKIKKFREDFKNKFTLEYPYSANKYGYQFRIYLNDTDGCPEFLEKQLDETYKNRINDTEFIRELVLLYGFMFTHENQNADHIKEMVQSQCSAENWQAFLKGYKVYNRFIYDLDKRIEKKNFPKPILKEVESNPKKIRKKANARNEYEVKSSFTPEQLLKLGWMGEEYFYNVLQENNEDVLKKLSVKGEYTIKWFNDRYRIDSLWKDKSVGQGCDMVIENEDRKIYLEIKTSKRNSSLFTMTSNEMQLMEQKSSDYYLVKINSFENILRENSPEVYIFDMPYDRFFKTDKIKEATFIIDR